MLLNSKLISLIIFIACISSYARAQDTSLQCQGDYQRYYPFRASPDCGTFAVNINSSTVTIIGLCDISKRYSISEITETHIVFNQGDLQWASINRLSGEFKYSENRRLGGGQLGMNIEFRGFCKPQKRLF